MDNKSDKTKIGANSQQAAFDENVQPPSYAVDDSKFHIIHVELSGFEEKEVTAKPDSSGKVVVGADNKISQVNQVFSVPENSDVKKMTTYFTDGLFTVIIPKKAREKNKEKKGEHNVIGIEGEKNHGKEEKPKEKYLDKEEKPKKDHKDKKPKEKDHKEEKPREEDRDKGNVHDGEKIEEKLIKEKDHDKGNIHDRTQSYGEKIEGFGSSCAVSAMEIVSKNTEVVLAAVFGFVIGLYLCHLFQ